MHYPYKSMTSFIFITKSNVHIVPDHKLVFLLQLATEFAEAYAMRIKMPESETSICFN